MTPALGMYFRRASFLGAHRVPAHGPVVVIGNHAASFLDAILMGVMLKRPIHFFVRGDIFRKAWVRWVFRHLHMMPIFSADLAKGDMHRNNKSFEMGADVLRKGGVLLIFPEGLSRMERNIMPLKKGVSRIILQALDSDNNLTVHVSPIGIHYTRHAFRADVQLFAGEALDVTMFREQYRDNAPKAVNALTSRLEEVFREVVLYVAQDDRSQVLEQQLEMLGHEWPGRYSTEHFRRQKQLCDQITNLGDEAFDFLKGEQDSYFAQLNYQELHDSSFASGGVKPLPFLLLLLGVPFFVAGLVLNFLPYLVGKRIADTKVTRADFYTSVLSAVSAFAYIIWLAILLSVALLAGSNTLLVLFALSPFLAWFSIHWLDEVRKWKFSNRYDTLKSSDPGLIASLAAQRALIRNQDPKPVRQFQDHP